MPTVIFMNDAYDSGISAPIFVGNNSRIVCTAIVHNDYFDMFYYN